VGITLLLTSSSSSSATTAPRVRVALGARGPQASFGFGF